MVSEETRRKLSEAAKRQHADPEKKAKIYEAQRRALQSPEVRAKMSKAAKEKFADPEKGEAARNANKEAMKRPEVRAKMSASAKKRFSDPEQRKATSEATKAAMADPEIRERVRKGSQNYWISPEAREKKSVQMLRTYSETDLAERISQATREAMENFPYSPDFLALRSQNMQARWDDPEQRAKLMEALREASANPQYREAQSKAGKKYWDSLDVEEREARILAILSAQTYRATSIELIVGNLLDSLGISYKAQWHAGGFCIDFYVPEKHLAIECDGNYWHSLPSVKEKDARKNEYLIKNGYKVIRLSESEINKGDFSELRKLLE